MPTNNITPQDYTRITGQQPVTQAQYDQIKDEINKDPLGYWWRTFVEGKGYAGQTVSAISNPDNLNKLGAATLAGDVRNAPAMNAIYQQGLSAPNRANPYNTGIADQSRAAQLALIQQMRAAQAGPSLAALQGQRGMAQVGQQALMQGGRAGMLGAQGASAGMAGDIGQARLAEMMRSQAGLGGVSGNLRGADLRSADAQSQMGLAQLRQDEARRQFYARQGALLEDARNQAMANRLIAEQQLRIKRQASDTDIVNNFLNTTASMASGAVGAGGK